MFKRLFDIVSSFLALLCLFPVFIIIAILIKLDSHGPVFFAGERVGRFNKFFKILKFRTMTQDADQQGGASSIPDDDVRLTRLGLFLRKYKLNELPQLINVLKGDMSFVGPRPQVKWAVDLYDEEEKQLLSVRPGITDYASIKFHNEGEILLSSIDPDKDYFEKIWPEKRRLSLEYVRNHSLWIDLGILLETFRTLIFSLFKQQGEPK